MVDDQEVYSAVGGDSAFFALVDAFYERVDQVPDLRSLYPADLSPGKKHLAWFLIQRFGGPSYFNENRGAPMLRRRHAPFAINFEIRDFWFESMMSAVDAVAAFAPYRELLETYFADAATFLINRMEPRTGHQVFRQI